MSDIFTTFAPSRTYQVLETYPVDELKSLVYVRKSPGQHGIIKGTISRAEVIGARDKRGRLILYKRLLSYTKLYHAPCRLKEGQVSLYSKVSQWL